MVNQMRTRLGKYTLILACAALLFAALASPLTVPPGALPIFFAALVFAGLSLFICGGRILRIVAAIVILLAAAGSVQQYFAGKAFTEKMQEFRR